MVVSHLHLEPERQCSEQLEAQDARHREEGAIPEFPTRTVHRDAFQAWHCPLQVKTTDTNLLCTENVLDYDYYPN